MAQWLRHLLYRDYSIAEDRRFEPCHGHYFVATITSAGDLFVMLGTALDRPGPEIPRTGGKVDAQWAADSGEEHRPCMF